MRRLLLTVTVCLLAVALPVNAAAVSPHSSLAELPKTVCDNAEKNLENAEKTYKNAEKKLKNAKKKVKEAKGKKAKGKKAKAKAKKKLKKTKKNLKKNKKNLTENKKNLTENKNQVGKQCLKVTSPAFENGEAIPTLFSCDGANVSPPLAWDSAKASGAELPEGTAEVALLVEDPDAPVGTFVHWVLYGVGSTTTQIGQDSLPLGATEGINGFGQASYGGPCPPQGDGPHRYFFTVFALSSPLGLGPNATATQVRAAAEGKTNATGQLFGTYERD